MTERGSRKTYIPFSSDDAVAIRQMVATPDTRVPCPRCSADLTTGTLQRLAAFGSAAVVAPDETETAFDFSR